MVKGVALATVMKHVRVCPIVHVRDYIVCACVREYG